MPAYDRPIRINVERTSTGPNAVAAVIKFNAGPAELERIQAFLDRLAHRGIIEPATARTYNTDISSPELYFP